MSISDFLNRIKKYREISNIDEIARRYFVMNGFDGILTILGVIIGTYIANIRNPNTVIITSVSACIAIGISGFSGTFMSEKAERTRNLKRLEKRLLTKLHNSILSKAGKFAYFYASLVAALTPLFFSIIILTPMFLASINLISYMTAFYSLLITSFLILFVLGMFLGKVSEENIIIWGMKMFLIGLITTFSLLFIGFILRI